MNILLVLATLSLLTTAQAPSTTEHRAWIATHQREEMLTIQGKFANHSAQSISLRYELVTTKQGPSGRSSSTQAGSFTAPPQQEVSLSNVTVNVTQKDTYVIELKVFRDGTVYLHDKIEYQG